MEVITIQGMDSNEFPFLEEMFYTSLFVPPGEAPFSPSIIKQPGLVKYLNNWGLPGDICFLAKAGAKPIGAVWCRFFSEENRGYGFVDKDIPELGIAIIDKYRSRGIGTVLMKKLIQEAQKRAYHGLSLSVDQRNNAINWYQRLGFCLVAQQENACTMALYFNKEDILSHRNS